MAPGKTTLNFSYNQESYISLILTIILLPSINCNVISTLTVEYFPKYFKKLSFTNSLIISYEIDEIG